MNFLRINKNVMKIRIPRKMKKEHYRKKHIINVKLSGHMSTPKLERYYYYFDTEQSMKRYNMTPEQLYNSFGFMLMDHIVWWNWVRIKYLNLPPSDLTDEVREYFNELMKKNKINLFIN